jgi:hypothetical protein
MLDVVADGSGYVDVGTMKGETLARVAPAGTLVGLNQ